MVKILVIDDEPLNNKLICAYLSDRPYDIKCVQSAHEALDLLNSNQKFDLILLDRMMPDMNGIEFATYLLDANDIALTPIILQTAAADKIQLSDGTDIGIMDILIKPFDQESLLRAVDSNLNRAPK